MKEIKLRSIKAGIDKDRKNLIKNKIFKRKFVLTRNKLIIILIFALLSTSGFTWFLARKFLGQFFGNNRCVNGDCVEAGGLSFDNPQMKQNNGVTTALLVGIDTRKDQPGLMNTDTIMLITYNHENGDVAMLSLPRDLYVRIPSDYPYWSRINSVYAQGFKDEGHDRGMDYLKIVVEEITGLTVNYNVLINYEGFLKIIDEIGGVSVYVENEFWGQYPRGEGWEQVHFEQGWQEMDGEAALKYSRTRYANYESGEATDFARAKRQQKIIMATKDKMLTLETLANPLKIAEIAKIAGDNIKLSSYNQEDIRAGINLVQEMDNSQITNIVLEPSINHGNLIHLITGDAYLLGPTSGSWEQIRQFVSSILENPELYQEQAQIYVYNGGASPGAAGQIAEELSTANPFLSITIGGNTISRNFENINIYDFSAGGKPRTIEVLQSFLTEATVYTEIPENVDNSFNEDIVIIVGNKKPETDGASEGM